MERKKRYNQEFVAWIEKKCEESGGLQPVDDQYYERFASLTNRDLGVLVILILRETQKYFNKKVLSNEWKHDDELFEFVMLFLELIAEGKVAFDEETDRMVFLKPLGDPPSDEMWNKIQKRISASPTVIRKVVVKHVKRRLRLEQARSQEGQ